MSLATCNGIPVISCDALMVLHGPWTAHVDLDVDDFTEGPVTLAFTVGTSTAVFYGTAKETAPLEGRTRVYVVGGRGGLKREIDARSYTEGTAATIARDIMFDSGESLAEGVENALRSIELDGWHRAQGTGARALTTLCARLGLQWRVLANGTVWIGVETWPQETSVPFELHGPDEEGTALFAPDVPALRPGTNILGRRISEVRYTLSGSALRSSVRYLVDATTSSDRTRDDFDAAVRGALPELEWLASHDASVIAQNADGTIQVACDDPRIGDRDRVPVYLGIPGASVTVGVGARVKIGWNAARPDQCFASLWATQAALVSLTIEADEITMRAGAMYLGRGTKRVLCEGDNLTLTGVQSGATAPNVTAAIVPTIPTDVPTVFA